MKKINLYFIIAMQIILAGCVSKTSPDINTLQKLDKDEIKLLLVGNTLTYRAAWGRWAEYNRKDYTGYAATWEDLFDFYGWQGEEATLSFEFSDKAEICRRYSGAPKWANPDFSYCSMIYVGNGSYYLVDTKNPHNSDFIGVINPLEIKKGDYYDLSSGLRNQEVRTEN